MKNLIALLVAVVASGVLAACENSSGPACGPSTCSGCCDVTGACQAGNFANACGSAGSQCTICALGQTCQLGYCMVAGTSGDAGGGGGGGGADGGGGGAIDGGGGTDGGGGGGGGGSGCATGLSPCSGTCVDTRSDRANCGQCGRACSATQTCASGSCQALPTDCRQTPCPSGNYCDLGSGQCKPGCAANADCPQPGSCDVATHLCSCAAGYHRCGGQCAPDYSPSLCGASCVQCTAPANGSPVCSSGSCDFACNAGYHRCGNQCLPNNSVSSCGSSCTPCSPPANGTATCNGASCDFTCNAGYHRCGSQCLPNNSVSSCGSSCNPCSPPANGTATCNGTSCDFTCNTGFHRCGNQCLSNTSPNSCGQSCTPCSAGPANSSPACNGGTCDFTCNTGFHRCGNVCVSDSSTTQCGPSCAACTPPANASPVCLGGSCDFTCNTGFHRCGSQCLSNASPQSCGQSCTPCATPSNAIATCNAGSCGFACKAGWHLCSGICVPDDSTSSCGASCSPCAPSGFGPQRPTCIAGVCGTGCVTSCNSTCVDLQSDPKHCGACGAACAANEACSQGSCRPTCASGIGFADLLPLLPLSGNISASDMALADFDGDAKWDLAVSGYGNSINLMRGNGNGTFQPATTHGTTLSSPTRLAVADFNGDGRPDLATYSNPYSGTPSAAVLLNNGAGGFNAPSLYAVAGAASGITAADFNSDGKPDLAVACQSAQKISVLLNSGTGTFAAGTTLTAVTPLAISSGDFNADGKPDLVVANSSSSATTPYLTVFPGSGAGTFQAGVTTLGSGNGTYLRVGDLNADGKADLVVNLYYGSQALLGTGTGGFSAPATVTGSNRNGGALADINNDGKLDYAVNTEGSNWTGTLYVNLGKGDGTFTYLSQVGPGGSNVATTLAEDLDGDGKREVLIKTGSGNVLVMKGEGTGRFPQPASHSASAYPRAVAVGDLNGDGRQDLFVSGDTTAGKGVPLFGQADGGFSTGAQVTSGSYSESVAIGDLDGDGYGDVVATTYSLYGGSAGINLLRGSASGTLSAPTFYATGSSPEAVALGDLSGDGKLDAAVACSGTGEIYVFLNTGAGALTKSATFSLNATTVAIADLNFDGRDDVIAAGTGLTVLLGTGGGALWRQPTILGSSYYFTDLAVADFNGDGRPDIAAAREYDPLQILLGNGNGTFTTGLTAGDAAASVAARDFDGDGKMDLLVGGFSVLRGLGNGSFLPEQAYYANYLGTVSAVAKLDGDAWWDVVVAHPDAYRVSVARGACR
ncbi:MAG: VCBS repeat-containing protein [Myxococcales bacterium]|nr:VCBS repeat-containing protein [Myxococcales bacterium]